MNKCLKTSGLFLAVSLSAALLGCGGGADRREAAPRSVMLVEVAESAGSEMKTFSGVVKEAGSINVGFKTAGQIATLAVKEGDYVKEGQLLATLDDADYRLGLDAAQAQYDQLKQEVERLSALNATGSIAGNDYDKALAGLRQVEVNLEANKNKVSYTRLYAPVGGYVQAVNFEPSEMVGAGTPVVTLLDTRRMEVWVNLPVSAYNQRDHMRSYRCTTPSGEELPLTPVSVNPKADMGQLYRMRLALPQGAQGITAGMNVEVAIAFADSQTVGEAALPASALFECEGGSCVWVFRPADSTVHCLPVGNVRLDPATGLASCTGLEAGMQVVRAGVNVLRDGEHVRPVAKPSVTNVGGIF